MKINTPIKINATELKQDIRVSIDNVIVPDLTAADAIVSGKKDENGDKIMIINGDIELEDIEDIFTQYGVDVNDYIVSDYDMIPDYDDVEVFDSLKKNVKTAKVNEKKTSCCPPKKKNKQNIVNLYEAMKSKDNVKKPEIAPLNTVIDNIVGNKLSESVVANALKKSKTEYLRNKLGTEKYNSILESVDSGAKSLHANVKINGKRIAEYSTDELKNLLEKVSKQIDTLNSKNMNESDNDKKLAETIESKNKVKSILEDEIDFRDAMLIKEEDENAEAPTMEFKNLNPNVDDKKTDESDDSSDDNGSDSSDDADSSDDSSDDNNPDEDEVVELGTVIITLASEDDANDLKNDLIDAGVPESAIEIEPVEDDEKSDEEESSEDETGETSDDTTGETGDADDNGGENSGEEQPTESVKTKNGKSVNEDDADGTQDDGSVDAGTDDSAADDTTDADTQDDGSADDSSDDSSAKSYKLILTDTDYMEQLADVLEDTWGMTKDEFEELIGGEIVSGDESSDDSDASADGGESSDDTTDDGSADASDDDFADFDPDELFKDF